MKCRLANCFGKIRLKGRIKRRYKYLKFKKYASIGKKLSISPQSDCRADSSGHIHIGDGCEIFGTLESQSGGEIWIGNHTGIYARSVVGSVNSIRIGSCVLISNHVHIYDNNNHPTSPKERRKICLEGFHTDARRWHHAASKPIVIEDDVWIGEYAAILKGVTIGKGAIVASHAVVTRDVPPYTIVAGNPARVVKEIADEE